MEWILSLDVVDIMVVNAFDDDVIAPFNFLNIFNRVLSWNENCVIFLSLANRTWLAVSMLSLRVHSPWIRNRTHHWTRLSSITSGSSDPWTSLKQQQFSSWDNKHVSRYMTSKMAATSQKQKRSQNIPNTKTAMFPWWCLLESVWSPDIWFQQRNTHVHEKCIRHVMSGGGGAYTIDPEVLASLISSIFEQSVCVCWGGSLVVQEGRGVLCCPGCRCRLWAWPDTRPPSSEDDEGHKTFKPKTPDECWRC